MNDPVSPFPKFGAGIGLHRVTAIARTLEIDLPAFSKRACVITGSNGKGSVAAMTAAILRAARPDVGCFTSPHLLTIRERFAIDGEAIDSEALERHWSRVQTACEAHQRVHSGDDVGGFEFLFLVAASWFAEQKCAFTVWEAGIGGRYDPTRLVRAPLAALVSLDLEHTALLGETLEQIAFDKLDACAPGGVLLCGESAAPLQDRIGAYGALQGVRTEFLYDGMGWRGEDEAHIVVGLDGALLTVAPPLRGPHQRNNTALATHLAYRMMRDAGIGDSAARAAIVAGLAETDWPGRLEEIETDPPVVIDVGHTPEAIRVAREGFMAEHRPCVLVCGASIDKAGAGMIGALAPGFRVIVCASAQHKGRPAAEIAAFARAANPDAELIVAESMQDARRAARARAQALHGAVYVAGGLFLAAEFKALSMGLDPAQLRFF